MAESTQHKLDRVRKPRVHITYDVETGGAEEKKELPFITGVMADFSGKPVDPLPDVKKRRFVEIDRDNFDKVLKSCNPRVTMRVPNKLNPESDELLNVEINFEKLSDFNPGKLVDKVEPLKKLYETRQRLNDLIAKLDGNDKLNKMLNEIVEDSDKLNALRSESAAAIESDEKDESAEKNKEE